MAPAAVIVVAGVSLGVESATMAKVIDKRPNGAVLVEVPADDALDLEIGADVEVHRSHADGVGGWPEPFGALAGTLPALEIGDIKAARLAALQGKTR